MSLGVVVKGPEGVVLAADSRVTLLAQSGGRPPIPVHFDNATKLLAFGPYHTFVAAVTYGAAVIGLRTAHSYLPEFEPKLGKDRLDVAEYAQRLSRFFHDRWIEVMPQDYNGAPMSFVVGGYSRNAAYGSVYLFDIPSAPEPQPKNPDPEFGMTWGGQREVATRLIYGYDPQVLPGLLGERLSLDAEGLEEFVKELHQRSAFRIPYDVLPLQDCVNLATFLIRTTMTALELAVELRGVGGAIDVAYITRTEGLQYVQRKAVRGEAL